MYASYQYTNDTAHENTLRQNLSQKYEFEQMIWEESCRDKWDCSYANQSEPQEMVLQVDGETRTFTLTQDPETNEPFLVEHSTGGEPTELLK